MSTHPCAECAHLLSAWRDAAQELKRCTVFVAAVGMTGNQQIYANEMGRVERARRRKDLLQAALQLHRRNHEM
jgi:hypothetical protein